VANEIKLKRSSTASAVPVVGDLALGELAINTYDGKLYLKKNDGSASIVEIGGGGSEVNDLSSVVTWADIPIANVPTGITGSTVALGNHDHSGVYLVDVVDDTSPVLGGNLDAGTYDITNTGLLMVGAKTPETWHSSRDVIQIGNSGSLFSSSSSAVIELGNNVYQNGSNITSRVETGYASSIELELNGTMNFNVAGTAAADSALTWTTTVLNNDGSWAFGGIVGIPNGSAATPGLAFATDLDTGIYLQVSNQVSISCAGGEAAKFNVGGMSVNGSNDITNSSHGVGSALTVQQGDTTGDYAMMRFATRDDTSGPGTLAYIAAKAIVGGTAPTSVGQLEFGVRDGASSVIGLTLDRYGSMTIGGNLDVNSKKIVSLSNGDIDIEPHGTGNVLLGNMEFDADQSIGAGQDNYVLTYDNTSGEISLEAAAGGGGLIAQGDLKTTTQNVTLTTAISSTFNYVSTGGQYVLYTDAKSPSWTGPYGTLPIAFVVKHEQYVYNYTTYTSGFRITTSTPSSYTYYARQRYIQASPPYDLGDGEMFGFIYLVIDNVTGEIIMSSTSPDPSWMHNGPTDTSHNKIGVDGKKYRIQNKSVVSLKDAIADPSLYDQYLDQITNPVVEEIEITQTIKNADMDYIPHVFDPNDLSGKTVILVDPMSDTCRILMAMHCGCNEASEEVSEIITKGYLSIGNTPLSRSMPKGVPAMNVTFKNGGV